MDLESALHYEVISDKPSQEIPNTCIKKGGVLENASKLKTKNTKVNWINIMKTKFSQGNIREVAKILQRMPYFCEKQ